MNSPAALYIDALLNNDEKILTQLYQEAIPAITSYILKNNGIESDARDIFQDALLAIFQKAQTGQLHINAGFQPYLFAVCRNLWLMQLRKRSQNRVTIIDDWQHTITTDSFADAEHTSNQYARLKLIEEHLGRLGDSCRNILRLAWSGKPLEEVAKLLNNSYAYVRKKKSECTGKLMELVKSSAEYVRLKA